MAWIEFNKLFGAGLIGFLSSQFVHMLSIKKDNIAVNRERFLENVQKLNNFIKYLIETSYVKSELIRFNELLESYRTNYQLIEQELNHIQEEYDEIEEKISNSRDVQEIDELKADHNLLSKKLSSVSHKNKHNRDQLTKIIKVDINRNRKRLDEISEHLELDNIETGLVLVDPSGKIVTYLEELQEIYFDPENLAKNQKRAILLQTKIDRIFTKEIKKFGLWNL